ncbi:uncharacterized protein YALI1_B11593g [Yarrowia lipolytica]|uniref:Uncharacterized protein n=1 Tax=Yarrowia lipolytica TaxID=4952 RepID=A0A1D8N721_YARLL|nr:hypothetical protein YALI1_B11593g [Yarrowia lipolytica]
MRAHVISFSPTCLSQTRQTHDTQSFGHSVTLSHVREMHILVLALALARYLRRAGEERGDAQQCSTNM